MKKILFISSNRADSGMIAHLIKEIKKNKVAKTNLLLTGNHLNQRKGYTLRIFKEESINIDYKIKIPIKNNNPNELNYSFAKCIKNFSNLLKSIDTNYIVILGDRYESLAIAIAAYNFNKNIIHLHGGEKTYNSLDEGYRHCISLISKIHFVSHKEYKNNLIKYGISKKNIFDYGSISVEKISKIKELPNLNYTKDKIIRKINKKFFVVLVHPENNSLKLNLNNLSNLFKVFDFYKDYDFVFLSSNNDIFGNFLNKRINRSSKNKGRYHFINSLSQYEYFILLKSCEILITNSSSGIYEAPPLKVPTLNLGKRQFGRIFPTSVFSSEYNSVNIKNNINRILKLKKNNLIKFNNPYYKKDATKKISLEIKKFIN